MLVNYPKTAIAIFVGIIFQSQFAIAQEEKNIPLMKDSGTTIVKGVEGLDSVNGTDSVLIDNEELEKNSYQHPADMLQDVTSVYTSTSYADPTISVNMRGVQDFGRVNTSIDGMRQNFQKSGYQDKNGSLLVDPMLLNDIAIDKGLSSGQGGLGTIGGQVNFRTTDIDDVIKKGDEGGVIIRGETGVGKWWNGNKVKSGLTVARKLTDNVSVLAAVTKTETGDYTVGSEGNSIIRPGRVIRIQGRTMRVPTEFQIPDHLRKTENTGYSIESQMAKIKWDISEYQSLKLSYINTEAEFNKVDYVDGHGDSNLHYWRLTANEETTNENISLDYKLNTDSSWLNLNAKVYRTTTVLDEYFPASQDITDMMKPMCAMAPDSVYFMTGKRCSAQTSTYETVTHGVNINNQSFADMGDFVFIADYGFEGLRDKTKPREINAPLGAASGVASTPDGQRDLASVYLDTRLDYKEWLSLFAGVRYDTYKLKGDANLRTKFPMINPGGTDTTFAVDNNDSAVSPTVGLAIRPFDFMEIYSNYGKGWRPPSLTETLLAGGTPSHGMFASVLVPSPELKPETSTNLDVGLKLNFNELLTDDDRLTVAFSKYRTRIENYMVMHLGVVINEPGVTNTQAFVNRTDEVEIKGSELAVNYDAGFIYAHFSGSMIDVDEGNQCYNPNVIDGITGNLVNNIAPCGRTFYSPFPSQDKFTTYLGTRLFDETLDMRVTMRKTFDKDNPLDGIATAQRLLQGNSGVGYTLWDLGISYQPIEDLTFTLYGKNLTDQQYSTSLGSYRGVIQGAGRSMAAAVKYKF